MPKETIRSERRKAIRHNSKWFICVYVSACVRESQGEREREREKEKRGGIGIVSAKHTHSASAACNSGLGSWSCLLKLNRLRNSSTPRTLLILPRRGCTIAQFMSALLVLGERQISLQFGVMAGDTAVDDEGTTQFISS